jgi:hypothetical protein
MADFTTTTATNCVRPMRAFYLSFEAASLTFSPGPSWATLLWSNLPLALISSFPIAVPIVSLCFPLRF